MSDDHPPGKDGGQITGKLTKSRRRPNIPGTNPVNVLRPEVPFRVHQSAPLPGNRTVPVEEHNSDLNHPVVPLPSEQPSRLNVDNRVTSRNHGHHP